MQEPHPSLGNEHVLAIVSPNNAAMLSQFRDELTNPFPKLEILVPSDIEHLAELVRNSAEKYKLLISIGGDGTFNEVLNNADVQHQILAVIPAGTGNDFARIIGVPREIELRTKWLIGATPRPTDFGLVNGLRYHNSAGFGIDTATLQLRQEKKNLLTKNYTIAFVMALQSLIPTTCKLTFKDNTVSGRYFWQLAMNAPDIGGGTKIAPKADIEDGLLDFVLVNECSKLKLLQMLPAATAGKHLNNPIVDYFQAESVTMELTEPQTYLALDGEIRKVDTAKFSFECIKGGMTVLR